jgi:2-polyprenyl-3-methyl-5-hydroxy-6-metoxy-1,4-benzoquinol methylase
MPDAQTCPNCITSRTRTVFVFDSDRRVLECGGCGLQFAETYPEIHDADSGIYGDEYFAPALDKRHERERIFEELLAEIEGVLGRRGRLLDVGCGEGGLIEAAARAGWQAEGTEISSTMIRYANEERGLVVHKGVLEDVPLETRAYDAVVMNHVLEHVRDPQSTLSRVCRLLAPGGLVRVEVPNLASFSSRLKNMQSRLHLKADPWKHYSTGHHFWFFTPQTLRRTVRAAGLAIVRVQAPAAQWGKKSVITRAANAVYSKTLWGGHLVVYAKKAV